MSHENYVNRQNTLMEQFRYKFVAAVGGVALVATGCSPDKICEYEDAAEYVAQPGDGVDNAVFTHNDPEELQGSGPRHQAREAFLELNPDAQNGLVLNEVYYVPKCKSGR